LSDKALTIYAAAGDSGVVKKYSPDGDLLTEYQDEYLIDASDVAVHTNGFVYEPTDKRMQFYGRRY